MLKIDNKELSLLEMLVYIIDEQEFHPFIFSHDAKYDHYKFMIANQQFIELIYFLGNIGITIDSEQKQYNTLVNNLLISITTLESNFKFWYFIISGIDYSGFDLGSSTTIDYPFIRLFIALRFGASFDKKSMCRILGMDLSSNDITQLKKVFKRKTSYVFVTNSDNSYTLRKEKE